MNYTSLYNTILPQVLYSLTVMSSDCHGSSCKYFGTTSPKNDLLFTSVSLRMKLCSYSQSNIYCNTVHSYKVK